MTSRVFTHFADGLPATRNVYDAWHGFRLRGHLVVPFEEALLESLSLTRDDLVVGGIGIVRRALAALGIAMPRPLDYPASLRSVMRRRVWETTLGAIRETEPFPVFVKPKDRGKSFTGLVVRSRGDLVRVTHIDDSEAIWASEPTEFRSEWRVYVLRGEVLGIGHYAGDPLVFPEAAFVDALRAAHVDAPAAYALDVGIRADGATDLVEANDGYSLGNYGLPSTLYAQLLEARWREIVDGSARP